MEANKNINLKIKIYKTQSFQPGLLSFSKSHVKTLLQQLQEIGKLTNTKASQEAVLLNDSEILIVINKHGPKKNTLQAPSKVTPTLSFNFLQSYAVFLSCM